MGIAVLCAIWIRMISSADMSSSSVISHEIVLEHGEGWPS